MRVNLEGEALETKVDEIFVDGNITLLQAGMNCVEIELQEPVLDIHEVTRLIKGLELAKKLFLEVEEEKE